MLQIGVEDEGEDHQVHGEEEPNVNHLEVWCGWQGLKKERHISCKFRRIITICILAVMVAMTSMRVRLTMTLSCNRW